MEPAIAALLLAAGRSLRFGERDKIAASLADRPLGHHAAQILAESDFTHRIVVTARSHISWPGFEIIENEHPAAGISSSIALGVTAARKAGADAILIALADMPFVTASHITRLVTSYRGPQTLISSGNEARRMPPALFGSDWFDHLERLEGDRGAGRLLEQAEFVPAEDEMLFDIDLPSDLAEATRRIDLSA